VGLKILLLNGPNLNLLGVREASVYGSETLEGITKDLQAYAERHDVELRAFQSNSEGALVEAIHQAPTLIIVLHSETQLRALVCRW
jgi:3-dehydroquinate dehydratase-2